MGMFDSVMAECPRCKSRVEFQSKAGECYCNVYTIETAPREVLEDVINDPHFCSKCGEWFALIDPAYPPKHETPPPDPKSVAVRAPKPGEFSMYQDGSFGWWEAPFSFSDLEDFPALPDPRPHIEG